MRGSREIVEIHRVCSAMFGVIRVAVCVVVSVYLRPNTVSAAEVGNPPALLPLSFKNAASPFLPPNRSSTYDSTVCMNPNIVQVDNEWRLYYAGADRRSIHRIALATAPVTAPTPANAVWSRRGVVLGNGEPGSFNSDWSVLPMVKKIGAVWHLYFTGRSSSGCPYTNRTGLQSFWGIGLATSTDGLHFKLYSRDPIILGNATKEYPDNFGIAGGGSLIEDTVHGGYRLYYTLAVGSTSHDVKVDQKKVCAVLLRIISILCIIGTRNSDNPIGNLNDPYVCTLHGAGGSLSRWHRIL